MTCGVTSIQTGTVVVSTELSGALLTHNQPPTSAGLFPINSNAMRNLFPELNAASRTSNEVFGHGEQRPAPGCSLQQRLVRQHPSSPLGLERSPESSDAGRNLFPELEVASRTSNEVFGHGEQRPRVHLVATQNPHRIRAEQENRGVRRDLFPELQAASCPPPRPLADTTMNPRFDFDPEQRVHTRDFRYNKTYVIQNVSVKRDLLPAFNTVRI